MEGLASGITSRYLPNLLSAQEALPVVEAGEATAVAVAVAVAVPYLLVKENAKHAKVETPT